jgi:hypothetical protein
MKRKNEEFGHCIVIHLPFSLVDTHKVDERDRMRIVILTFTNQFLLTLLFINISFNLECSFPHVHFIIEQNVSLFLDNLRSDESDLINHHDHFHTYVLIHHH